MSYRNTRNGLLCQIQDVSGTLPLYTDPGRRIGGHVTCPVQLPTHSTGPQMGNWLKVTHIYDLQLLVAPQLL